MLANSAPAIDGRSSADDRPNLYLAPVLDRYGRPDWRTWTKGVFLPKLSQMTTVGHLAYLLGDNAGNLIEAKRYLTPDTRAELEAAEAAQWKAVE